jgi:multidrug efflux pump subunit AcrA (membrane-fusion protein)
MAGLDKRQLRREIEKARREEFKGRLLELRSQIASARLARKEAVRQVQIDCARARVEARLSCQQRAALAKERGAVEVAERQAALKGERGYEKQIRAGDRPRAVRSTKAERRQESDDEVRSNLRPDMVPVFNAVKRHIKGTTRKSRTEAFLEWAEENPEEVFPLMQHEADKHLARLIAEHTRTERQARGYKVPF